MGNICLPSGEQAVSATVIKYAYILHGYTLRVLKL